MLTIIYDEDQKIFKAKGSFKLGIAGVYENQDFDGEKISIDEDMLDNIIEHDEESVGPILPFIKSDAPDEIAEGLTEYYNQLEKRAAENEKQINDGILSNLFRDMEGCGYPFWDLEGLIDSDFKNAHEEDDDLYDVIYGDEEVADLAEYFEDSPNDGSVKKPDVEARIRQVYPMFNLDLFINSIQPEFLHLNGRYISFQFDDGWDGEIACGAYDELDENFTFTDWHNH